MAVEQRHRFMVDELIRTDCRLSAEWERVFRRVPRDAFLGDFWHEGELVRREGERERWLDLVYSPDEVLVTVQGEGGRPLSSSSMPRLMFRFLALLQVQDGNRVLEIGTGTGYNAALLCERLGSELVTSIDVAPELVNLARQRMARLGYGPQLAVADGWEGYSQHAPYDRIIATCSVPRIPEAWLDQLAPTGVIVTPLAGGRLQSGLLVGLRACSDRFSGRADEEGVAFMGLRSAAAWPQSNRVPPATNPTRRAVCHVHPWALHHARAAGPDLFAGLQILGLEFGWSYAGDGRRERVLAAWNDGSWARLLTDGEGYVVVQAGPRRLWDLYEVVAEEWAQLGCPLWSRYGLTVTPGRQQILWLDSPDSEHTWAL